jgi:arylsulfatase A-like enzyme
MAGWRKRRWFTALVAAAVLTVVTTTTGPGDGPTSAVASATVPSQGFSDLPASGELADAARWMVDQAISTGYPDGTYRPARPITRAAFAVLLWRALGSPAGPGEPFSDVRPNDPAGPALGYLADVDIARGYPGGTYRPQASVTREQAALFVWRALGAEAGTTTVFPDVGAPQSGQAVGWLADHGVVAGFGDGTFRPVRPLTRGPAALVLHRAFAASGRTNVVVVMTDDQTLSTMSVMDQTQALLGDEGVTFERSFASFPLCCPSRATFLTGQYAHNHGVINNVGPNGGVNAFEDAETLPVWLQRAGYTTSAVGKYLNGYDATLPVPGVVPPGWDRWFGMVDPAPPTTYRYYDYDISVDGAIVEYGSQPEDYLTDVLSQRAVDQVHEMGRRPEPFFLWLSVVAPHSGFGAGAPNGLSPPPAPRHADALDGVGAPRPPSFWEEDLSDKPQYVQDIAALWGPAPLAQAGIDRTYEAHLESLLAVDEAVAEVVEAIEDEGALDRTLIVFTSDNGLMFGEHKLAYSKVIPYEESARVPLLARGPGLPAGTTVEQPVANIDIAATVLDAAATGAGLVLDGRSLVGLTADPEAADTRALLLEGGFTGSAGAPRYAGVHTSDLVFIEYETGERELYDLAADPYQLENLAGMPAWADVQVDLAAALDQLEGCAGAGCQIEVTVTRP